MDYIDAWNEIKELLDEISDDDNDWTGHMDVVEEALFRLQSLEE